MKAEESTGKKRKPRVPSLQQRIKSKERQKRYRARSSVISVSREIVQELQAIGQENGISSNGDVIALLISTYRQVSASTPGGARQQNEAHSERCQLNLASDWGDRTVAIFHPVELADIPTDGQERRQEKHKRWKPTRIKGKRARVTPQNDLADTLTHPGNKNRKRDASTLIRKRITLAIRFESGPDVTVRGASICEVRAEADEERSGCKKMEIEKQEEKKQKEEEEEEKEEEWLESEPEEQYDSKDLDYLSSPAAEKDTNEGEEPFKRKKALR
ncbi:uncharacterized protein [Diadema setosum]|uniref:uncharacterized protein n=1 Tax=Diadema setosum TaxID=31175 RepID=UPI003B3AB574